MSNAQLAASTASGVDNTQPTVGDKVVLFPQTKQSPSTDYTKFPLTKEADDLWYVDINTYSDAMQRRQRETRRHYLPLPAVQDIAAALGRQITVEDMNLLVGLDGEKAICSITGREFQPVWWVMIKPKLLDAIAHHKAINEDVLRSGEAIRVGQYFPNPNPDSIENFMVAGVPYFWKKGMDNGFAYWSPMWEARKINRDYWGDTKDVSDKIMESRRATIVERNRLKAGLSQFAQAFENARPQRGRDRRQVQRRI